MLTEKYQKNDRKYSYRYALVIGNEDYPYIYSTPDENGLYVNTFADKIFDWYLSIEPENKNIIYRVTHISYLYFSFSLTILYVLGLTDTAGEAIVRLSGLYSAPFLLLALNSNIKDGYISYYYTSGNSLFFLNNFK